VEELANLPQIRIQISQFRPTPRSAKRPRKWTESREGVFLVLRQRHIYSGPPPLPNPIQTIFGGIGSESANWVGFDGQK
jgi:hypothetical protein